MIFLPILLDDINSCVILAEFVSHFHISIRSIQFINLSVYKFHVVNFRRFYYVKRVSEAAGSFA